MSEVTDIKWINIAEVSFVDPSNRLSKLVNNIFHIFKSKYKQIY